MKSKAALALRLIPDAAATTALAAMPILVGIAVLSRYTGWFVATWTDELTRIAFAWAAFLGGAVAVKHRAHFRMTLLRDRAPASYRRWLDIASDVALVVMGAMLVFFGISMVQLVAGQLTPVLRLPAWLNAVAVPIGGSLMAAYAVADLSRRLRTYPDEYRSDSPGLGGNSK